MTRVLHCGDENGRLDSRSDLCPPGAPRATDRAIRSDIVSTAVEEYAARHTPDEITEALNAAVDGDEPDPFADAAAARLLRSVEW